MKSKNEFSTESEYLEYLRFYYAGLAMQGLITKEDYEFDALAYDAIKAADELIIQLFD